ncbi:MAG: WS/DGAT domain-containing protein [Actinomycetota bacterium]|nr:WS/DGAT domain-containing protein [Actinomycetota bacterium]
MAPAGAVLPLSAEDQAILALESERVAGHTCKVVVVGNGAPGLEALRATVDERLALAPELTRRLGGTTAAPAWVHDERFDVAAHIVPAGREGLLDRSGLEEAVASIFEQRLDRTRPLWRIDVLNLSDGGAALVWRLHHALADGTTAMRLARAVLWDEHAESARPAAHPAADNARRRAHLARVVERELASSRERSPFDGRIGRRRRIALARVALGPLHDAAKRLDGATVNDAVLAVVAGALRRWVQHHHGPLGELRVRVPVSMHHEGEDAGNRDSFFSLALPLNEADPVVRLRAAHAATAERKADRDAQEMDHLLRALAGVSPRLERFCERLVDSPRRFALSVSNVPGPAGQLSVLGAPVHSVHSLAEIGERHALRVAVISVAGELCFGLCADPAIVDGLQEMSAGIVAEARSLVEAAAG